MSSKYKESNDDQSQFWQMAIEIWRSSGLSVRQFCKQEGLSEPSFYSWRRKLTGNDPEQNKKDVPNLSSFIEVAIPKDNPALLELLLSSGNTLRISSGADSRTLTNILSALCEVGLC